MSETLILLTEDFETAKELFAPLENTSGELTPGQYDHEVSWSAIKIQKGLTESIFEIVAKFDWKDLALSASVGVLSNWIWDLIKRSKAKKQSLKISLHKKEKKGELTIDVDINSEGELSQKIEIYLQDDKNEHAK